jgi:hypothetical protein
MKKIDLTYNNEEADLKITLDFIKNKLPELANKIDLAKAEEHLKKMNYTSMEKLVQGINQLIDMI